MEQHTQTTQPAGLFIRFAALLIDALAIILLECLSAGILIALIKAVEFTGLITFASYQNLSALLSQHPVISPLMTAYLAAIWIGYFVWSWTKKGQTPGMKVWKLCIKSENNTPITITQALIRLFTSGFGLSNLLIPFDPQKRGFHDIWAQTQVFSQTTKR